jgi:hypothetical protein
MGKLSDINPAIENYDQLKTKILLFCQHQQIYQVIRLWKAYLLKDLDQDKVILSL